MSLSVIVRLYNMGKHVLSAGCNRTVIQHCEYCQDNHGLLLEWEKERWKHCSPCWWGDLQTCHDLMLRKPLTASQNNLTSDTFTSSNLGLNVLLEARGTTGEQVDISNKSLMSRSTPPLYKGLNMVWSIQYFLSMYHFLPKLFDNS